MNTIEIKQKIAELQKISTEESPQATWEWYREQMNKQDKLMDELKTLARESNTILGRILKFQIADSYAVYVIIRVNKATITAQWVNYCDGWVDDRLGYLGRLDREYAEEVILREDAMDRLFAQKKTQSL